MAYFVPEQLNHDLSKPAIVHSAQTPWTPSQQPGVERRFLDRDGGEVARATSIVRYAPNSSFPAHVHAKGEEYLVLSGVFSDEFGDFPEGAYVRNPPGSRHAPFTKEGCVIFVKLRQIPDSDSMTVRLKSPEAPKKVSSISGLARRALYESMHETVALENYDAGVNIHQHMDRGGEEILVLSGSLLYGDYVCESGTWLRFPPGLEQPMRTKTGCKIWVKRRHLRSFSN